MKIYSIEVQEVECCETCSRKRGLNLSDFGCKEMNGKKIVDLHIVATWCPLLDKKTVPQKRKGAMFIRSV